MANLPMCRRFAILRRRRAPMARQCAARGILQTMRLIALAIVLLALPTAWLAGEQHRESCVAQDRAGCSVLPWKSGYCEAPVVPGTVLDERRLAQAERDGGPCP